MVVRLLSGSYSTRRRLNEGMDGATGAAQHLYRIPDFEAQTLIKASPVDTAAEEKMLGSARRYDQIMVSRSALVI